MLKYKLLYQKILLLVFALYVYFGKGLAYSYLAEFLLVIGILLLIIDRKNINIIKSYRSLILFFLLFINIIYIFKGVFNYTFFDVLRDSFIFNYIYFAIIIFLFFETLADFIKSIIKIYQYYPLIVSLLYLLSLNNFFGNLSIFGQKHILYFKYGDILVHLYISLAFMLTGYYNFTNKLKLINLSAFLFLFIIASSYNRSGMLSFLIAFIILIIKNKNLISLSKFKKYFYNFLICLIFIIPIIYIIPNDENFQGRRTGVNQISNNITSIFSDDLEGSLTDNKVWRYLWWAKIIDYTFAGPHFYSGKGIGINLAQDDDISYDSLDSDLRSPHNFHLNVLARYGVPIFILWLSWLVLTFIRLKNKNITTLKLVLITVQIAFIINSTFDVYLEGPMAAFPFWLFVGIDFITDIYTVDKIETKDLLT
jgi:hypothetical protein